MASPGAAKYLWDARRAAEKIARFTSGRKFDDYLTDDMMRAAVERQFEIVGGECYLEIDSLALAISR